MLLGAPPPRRRTGAVPPRRSRSRVSPSPGSARAPAEHRSPAREPAARPPLRPEPAGRRGCALSSRRGRLLRGGPTGLGGAAAAAAERSGAASPCRRPPPPPRGAAGPLCAGRARRPAGEKTPGAARGAVLRSGEGASAPGRFCPGGAGRPRSPGGAGEGPRRSASCAEAGGVGQPCGEPGLRDLMGEQSFFPLAHLGNDYLLFKRQRGVGSSERCARRQACANCW